jgi:hypothetical protein
MLNANSPNATGVTEMFVALEILMPGIILRVMA